MTGVLGTKPISELVWERWLDSKFNVRYYKGLWDRFSLRNKGVQAFLLVASSSTVAGWAFWASVPLLWQALSALAAITAIVAPLLGYSRVIGDLADGYGRWVQAESLFGTLWDRVSAGQAVTLDEYEKAKAALLPARTQEIGIPIDDRLRERCYEEVLREVNA